MQGANPQMEGPVTSLGTRSRLTMAAAERLKLDAIVTRDATGFEDSPVPVLSPAELVQQL